MIETFFYGVLPFLIVFIFLLFERKKLNHRFYFNARDRTIILIDVLGVIILSVVTAYVLSLFISVVLLFQFIKLADLHTSHLVVTLFGLILADFIYYWVHRLHHLVPWLWRLHRLHHSDKKVDALTGLFHHPLEVCSSFFIAMAMLIIIGVPSSVIRNYALLLLVNAAYTHSRLLLPYSIDYFFRLMFVTPKVHRIHHAKEFKLSNTNFGQVLTVWDRLFGTYSNPRLKEPSFGIENEQAPKKFNLKELSLNPLR
jgi:sterol desaturase/sphingolipid hydroxylase (fatty acid hydroxylase superfamily)